MQVSVPSIQRFPVVPPQRRQAVSTPLLSPYFLHGAHLDHKHYRLVIAPRGSSLPDVKSAPTASFAATATSGSFVYALADDTTYEVRLYSVSRYGLVSEATRPLFIRRDSGTGTTSQVSEIPINIRATQSDGDIALTWDLEPQPGSEPDSFNIYRAEDLTVVIAIVTASSGQTSYRWSETPATDGRFCYRVTSVKGTFESFFSRMACARLDTTEPTSPTCELVVTQEA